MRIYLKKSEDYKNYKKIVRIFLISSVSFIGLFFLGRIISKNIKKSNNITLNKNITK